MRKSFMLAGALSLVVGAAACTSFLTDSTASTDPNNPATVTTAQLFTAVQAAQFLAQEGNPAFLTCLFMQQCQGVGGRFVSQESEYTITNATANADFAGVYGGGGLLDIKTIESRSEAAGDLQYKGIAEVWEALVIGTAADVAEPGTVRTRLLPSSDIVREALDFRFAVEPAACGLAARCATAQDLETIKSQATAIVRAQDDREFNEHNASLHAAIGVASHNRFYAMALKQIQYVVDEINEVLPDSPAWHDSALTEHAAIVEAIVAGSEQKAVEAMRVHIERTDVAARAVLEAMHRERR